MAQGIVIFDEELEYLLFLLRLQLVLGQERSLQPLSPLTHDCINRIFERLHQYLCLFLLCDEVFLVLDSLLACLVLLYLCVQTCPSLLEHDLPSIIVLFEYLLHLASYSRTVCILVGVLL